MITDSVRNSRAGDKFHYLWAARRCLKMLHPLSPLCSITVEGSPEPNADGELVIDLSEVRTTAESGQTICYYQLKHSTVRKSKTIPLSELEKTLKGFAARFRQKPQKDSPSYVSRDFYFVSNREVSSSVKCAVKAIAEGLPIRNTTETKLSQILNLTGAALKCFCSSLHFEDKEGDYIEQQNELRSEITRYTAGTLEESMLLKIEGLVWDQALPQRKNARSRGTIVREQVLKSFGVSQIHDLFPARQSMEGIEQAFKREQHAELVQKISNASGQVIVHASGGVGKSIVAQQLATSFPKGSVGLVYDCFGGGNYLNESKPRHRPCDALVQIANELATEGLCQILLPETNKSADAVMRAFLGRLQEACAAINERSPRARLVILVDAADNAEMAAQIRQEPCFASMLIRETLPSNCRIVFLCRSERRKLLKPLTRTTQVLLKPFSLKESARHLKNWYPKATDISAKEFHRLTGGNPRVQANCLAFESKNIRKMLDSLGPGRTVEKQIAEQLEGAINKLRDQHAEIMGEQIDCICRGLATLPPFIPIPVLAAAAKVEPGDVLSFISDIGRPLWHSDDAVQFRDEPTEKWFKDTYTAKPDDYRSYAEALVPLSAQFPYAARALPSLWFQSGDHDRLIDLAISDEMLPENSPIDARDIRVYRLQYAFKAALKLRRVTDAAKLAFRAGEEMAGNQRQIALLEQNVDLMSILQDAHRVQECACKSQLRSGWHGSENVYSASLLSSHSDFQGEASSYLRAAHHWLKIHFSEREKLKERERHNQDTLKYSDIAEFAWAHLNLEGPQGFVDFISTWNPPKVIYEVTQHVVGQLIDAGRFDKIHSIAACGKRNPYLIIALCNKLANVAKIPNKNALELTLTAIVSGSVKFEISGNLSSDEGMLPGIVSFAEACAYHQLSSRKICAILELFAIKCPSAYTIANDHPISSNHDAIPRHRFSRAVTLYAVLKNEKEPDPKLFVPDPSHEFKKKRTDTSEVQSAQKILSVLLPLYFYRAQILIHDEGWRKNSLASFKHDSRPDRHHYGSNSRIDVFWDELPLVRLGVLALHENDVSKDNLDVLRQYLRDSSAPWFNLPNRIRMTRLAYRHSHLVEFGKEIEQASRQMMESSASEEADSNAQDCILLARAVLAVSKEDASAYFDNAMDCVSKYGDELLDRWKAICTLAKKGADKSIEIPELTYRFVRCSELVGSNVTEKYWDRPDALRIALHMHPPSAFAALSRWRDRDVGWFSEQVEALSEEAVGCGVIKPSVGFCLGGFEGSHASIELLKVCLINERKNLRRQELFDRGVDDFYAEGVLLKYQAHLYQLATSAKVNQTRLEELTNRAERIQARTEKEYTIKGAPESHGKIEIDPRIKKILETYDITSVAGLGRIVTLLSEFDPPVQIQSLWSEIVALIPRGSETRFMRAVVEIEEIDSYDIRSLIHPMRLHWKSLSSVSRDWPVFFRSVGKKYFTSLLDRGAVEYWKSSALLDDSEIAFLQEGVRFGIESATMLLGCGAFFGFIPVLAKELTPREAREVLDYALERLEIHMSPEFGDGVWDQCLNPPSNLVSFTGFLWAALGSPEASTRWQAAHSVRRLVELQCNEEITSLLEWIERDGIAAFIGKDFVFYRLHAVLYLLFGIARGSIGCADILLPHTSVFVNLALESGPHALIQPEAARIALSIEKTKVGTLAPDISKRLNQVGKTPFRIHRLKKNKTITPLNNTDYTWKYPSFGMEFGPYWQAPLGDVFNVSSKQVEGLMREFAIDKFSLSTSQSYPDDPRRKIWNRLSYPSGLYHHHGSYPNIDDFNFYYSFHALMMAGAKLLETYPLITRYSDEKNPWNYWLCRHQLTRSDGRWLADRRDPTLPSRKVNKSSVDGVDWLWGISSEDFFDVLSSQVSIPGGLCVSGSWSDTEYDQEEDITIESVFVRPETAESLANSIRTAEDPYLCQLSNMISDEDKKTSSPFDALEWIYQGHYSDPRIDSFDYHSRQLRYSPRKISPWVVKKFNLHSDVEDRIWKVAGEKLPVAIIEAWSDKPVQRRESKEKRGERIVAAVPFLRELCRSLGRVLVICVRIRRNQERRHQEWDSDFSYFLPSHKVFIFEANGPLRDTTTNHRVG